MDPRLIRVARRANGLLKRSFDVVVASLALIFLSPVILTITIALKATDPGPIFFGHKRVGRYGAMFRCWKFRTMIVGAEEKLAAYLKDNPQAAAEWEQNQKLKNDPRVTWLGNILRKTSLDEIPQLYNVLIGEMSLIGPRPVTRQELDRYGRDRKYYLLVRPGITGLWQVSGRSRSSYERRVALDREYVERWTFLRDLRIAVMTIPAVLTSDGAY